MVAKSWIHRSRAETGYSFKQGDNLISDKEAVRYFTSLGIPPAWEAVQIAVNRRAKVLAKGIDAAGRIQYIYHPKYRAQQEAAKFERVLRFARALPQLRKTVDQHLTRSHLDRQKVLATIISIMDQTYIRIGNDSYARDNQSYGLTTLRSKHTSVEGSTITFDFVGKSGKRHVKKLTNRKLATIVRRLDELPGYEVFKYYDDDGKLHDVKSADVNAYIKEIMGEEFSAKDFRTWAGTLIASAELASAKRAESERERKKIITACVKKVAKKLGNTPAIARSSYIDPRIITMFMEGEELAQVGKTLEKMRSQKGSHYLSPEEQCVVEMLEG